MKFVQEISVFNPNIMYDTVTSLETSISTTAEGIRTDVRAIYASKAELSSTFAQSAHTITMGVTGKASKTSGASITITLKDANDNVISEGSGNILIDGNVVFTDQLSTAGQTTINGSNITGGTITLGGNNNGNGWLKIVDASSAEVGRWTKDGITVTTGVIKLGGKTSLTDGNTGLYLSSGGIALGASSAFKVTDAGALTANSATVTGTINASSGIIGVTGAGSGKYWNIGGSNTSSDKRAWIYSGSRSQIDSTNAGIYIGTDGISVRGTSGGVNNWMRIVSGDIECTSVKVYDHGGSAYGTMNIDGTDGDRGRICFPRGASIGTSGVTVFDFDCFADAYFLSNLYSQSGRVDGTTSDIRIKEDIVDIPDDVAKSFIMALRPKEYHLINSESEDRSVGFIAQELHEVMPEGWDIWYEKRDREGVRYPEIIAPLVKMVQLQQQEIDALKGRIQNG